MSDDEENEWDTPTHVEAAEFLEEEDTPLSQDDVPTAVRCRECGGPLEKIENWRPPDDAADAWRWAVDCGFRCIVTRDGADLPWSFCPRVGAAWVAGHRVDFERRKMGAPSWDGEERRRQ